jgi:hypothetical protein
MSVVMNPKMPSIESELAAIHRMDELQSFLNNHGMEIHIFVLRPCWHVTLTLVRRQGNIEAKAKDTSLETALVKAGANLDALVGGRY